MLKRILTALLAVALLTAICPMALAADSTTSSTETVWSDEYIPNGDFEGTKDYSAKSNASLVSTTDTGHGSYAVSVNKGGYTYFTQYYPTPDDSTALNRRLTLINAAKAGGKLKLEFDVKPASGDTLTQMRIMLRTGSSEFGAKYLVPAECTIDNVAQSTIFSAAKSSAGTTNLSLTGGQWYHFCLVYDFNGIDTDTSSALYAAETDGFWTFLGVNGNSNGGVTLFDNISVKTADPVESGEEETPEEELPPFRDTPNPASGVTLATEAEIASLGDLPEGIGTIYKKTVTIGSGNTTTCELLHYPNALTREGDYDLKVFLFEPTTNPATDGTGLHRMVRYSTFSTSNAWKSDVGYVMYDQNANMGVWNTYDGTITLEKSNTKVASAYTTDRIGFRWVLGNDTWSSMTDKYPDVVGQTATLYFSISLTSGVKPDKATAVIETTKWSGENLFDEAGYLASSGAVTATVGDETVISAGSNYTLVHSALDLTWDPSALYRISFKACGDGTSTYSTNARVQFRTNSATEFTGTIPAADLATGDWNEYSMICDMSTLEQTFKDGNTMLCDRGTTTWWLMLRRGSSSEGPVYYKDIVFEKAVPTATGETPVYTSGIFTFENNSLETLSIPQGTLILAIYNADGSLYKAVTKPFVKNVQTFTLKKQNTADSETYEGQVGGIIPDSTGAVRIDIEGYDSTKTYQLMVWDSVTGMNSLFGVTASK